MKSAVKSIDSLCVDTVRFLAVDAVEQAKSGHPGMPLGAAPIMFTLWDRHLRHHPGNPTWLNRDRFVLSAGHASALLYAMLHLSGYKISLDDLRLFRQWESKTPGHPELNLATGIEVTTGPLGQGFANGVGMALAERWLGARFNRLGHKIIDHQTYVLASDGDLMEGVTAEAASFAGTQQLGKLIVLYDDNEISIEGDTALAFTEDVARRFRAYGWHVVNGIEGEDLDAVDRGIQRAKAERSKPSLVICKTVIGYGSPIQGTAKTHGEPLGSDHARATKKALGWPQKPLFHVPQEVSEYMKRVVKRGREYQKTWQQMYASYQRAYPSLYRRLERQIKGELPYSWDKGMASLFEDDNDPSPTRNASGKVLNLLAKNGCPLVGGSADLGPSNKTTITGQPDLTAASPGGSNIHFGVREHAMGSIANGLVLHGGIRPYTGTFLIFSDYMRPPMRMAALMGLPVIFIFSHDSIGVGEDGPTHQPIEQVMSLRLVPNLTVIRPADNAETAWAWRTAMQNRQGPTAIILTRQKVPQIDRQKCEAAEGLQKGAYILWQSGDGQPELILIASGSEVHLALDAGAKLAKKRNVRVVSMPSWELFEKQSKKYRQQVLPHQVSARIAVEAGITSGWQKYVGLEGRVVGMSTFGASAPGTILFDKFNITVEAIIKHANELLK